MKKRRQLAILLAIVAIFSLGFVGDGKMSHTLLGPAEASSKEKTAQKTRNHATFTAAGLYKRLVAAQVDFPEMFTQVAIAESGWQLKSPVAMQNNNFFGFIYPSERFSYSTRENLGHAWYPSIEDAIADLKLWISLSPPLPGENPYAFLRRRGYNQNPAYYTYLASID
ncbi:MAG: glucosaminidase domain-containing protein, partial [Sphingobacteriia bacterium]